MGRAMGLGGSKGQAEQKGAGRAGRKGIYGDDARMGLEDQS